LSTQQLNKKMSMTLVKIKAHY